MSKSWIHPFATSAGYYKKHTWQDWRSSARTQLPPPAMTGKLCTRPATGPYLWLACRRALVSWGLVSCFTSSLRNFTWELRWDGHFSKITHLKETQGEGWAYKYCCTEHLSKKQGCSERQKGTVGSSGWRLHSAKYLQSSLWGIVEHSLLTKVFKTPGHRSG